MADLSSRFLAKPGKRHRACPAITLATIFGLCVFSVAYHSGAAFLRRRSSHETLLTPAELQTQLPIPQRMQGFVNRSRTEVIAVLEGEDDRLIAVVGPCSIHDPKAVRDYAAQLAEAAAAHSQDLLVVMRAYLEKPRTSVGWRGLISDPDLSGGEDLERGLALGRRILLDLNALGLPVAVEFLDPLVAPYLQDLVSYGSIGARTVESPQHRALAAALPMPIGFKNTRSGDVQSAVNAVIASASPQRRLELDAAGRLRAAMAAGNAYGHVVLRGGEAGPNYDSNSVADAVEGLAAAGFTGRRVVVDCSHGNSGKKHEGQVDACSVVAEQVSMGSASLAGVMVESFLEAGNQPLSPGETPVEDLRYGQSVTDACVDLATTRSLLDTLSEAVRARRALGPDWQEVKGST